MIYSAPGLIQGLRVRLTYKDTKYFADMVTQLQVYPVCGSRPRREVYTSVSGREFISYYIYYIARTHAQLYPYVIEIASVIT